MSDGAIKTSQSADVSLSDTTNIPNTLFLAAWIRTKQGAELPPSVNFPVCMDGLASQDQKNFDLRHSLRS